MALHIASGKLTYFIYSKMSRAFVFLVTLGQNNKNNKTKERNRKLKKVLKNYDWVIEF